MKKRKTNGFGATNCLLALLVSCAALGTTACGDDDAAGNGSLSVLVEAEDTIIRGLVPGELVENVRDGWSVVYDKFIVSIGDIDLHLATDDSVEAVASDVFAVDLKKISGSGLALWNFDGLKSGRWEFNFRTGGAGDGGLRHDSVSQPDFDAMVAADWTYFIDGVMSNPSGQSCPPASLAAPGAKTPNGNTSGGNACYAAPTIRFTFGASAETNYGPCEIDEVPGVAVSAGTAQTVAVTIHGDHLFFNGFPEGDEGGVLRLAQWLADCDLDLDGTVTQNELSAITPAQLPELDDRYQLGGSPITPLDTVYDYVRSQMKTQGHFQGEGECPVDGAAHEH